MGDEKQYHTEVLAAMRLNVGGETLWKEYKSGFLKEEWPSACEEIFSSVKLGNYRIFPWYALEERYDLMMDALKVNFYSDHLKTYEKKLKALYPERCLTLLVADTIKMAEQSSKRADYRRVAKNLRWIQRYPGGDEKAEELANDFRTKYRQRRAMMEEIDEF